MPPPAVVKHVANRVTEFGSGALLSELRKLTIYSILAAFQESVSRYDVTRIAPVFFGPAGH